MNPRAGRRGSRKKAPAGSTHGSGETAQPGALPCPGTGRTCPGGSKTLTECDRGPAQHEGRNSRSVHAHCVWIAQPPGALPEAETQAGTRTVISDKVYCLAKSSSPGVSAHGTILVLVYFSKPYLFARMPFERSRQGLLMRPPSRPPSLASLWRGLNIVSITASRCSRTVSMSSSVIKRMRTLPSPLKRAG